METFPSLLAYLKCLVVALNYSPQGDGNTQVAKGVALVMLSRT